jgi:HK97 family phage major capsid protein
MKRTNLILSMLFFAVLGTVLCLAINFEPSFGLLLSGAAFLPMPHGILGDNIIPATKEPDNEKEKELIQKFDDRIKKSIKEFDRGFINEEGLKLKLEPITKALEDKIISSEQFMEFKKTFEDSFNEMAESVSKLAEKGVSTQVSTKADLLVAIKKAAKELQGRGDVPGFIDIGYTEKTVGTMTVGANVTGQMPQADREAGFNNVVRQTFTIRNGSNVFPITSTLAEWVEQSGIEGSADMTAEGASKSQMDWDYTVRNAAVRKITAYVKISEEMLNDIEGMLGEINGNLAYQVELKEEVGLITGPGTGKTLNGIEKYAQALDLAALSGTVEAANNWDVLAAAITQIKVEAKASANRIFLNPVDIFLTIHASKDTTNDYINPVTVVPNATPGAQPSIFVWGVPVVESDSITAGEFLVADMTKFTIRDKQAFTVAMGLDGNDFTKDLVTLRGVKRLVSYVKINDNNAFVTDTFADGKAFLETAS